MKKKIKPVYHPSVLPRPTRSPALPPTKEKYVQHLWQIGTAVITFKYYHTQKQHTSLRKKKPPIFQVSSTRKKEYKTYTLLRSFLFLNLLETDRLPLSKAIQLCGCIYFFVGFFCIFFKQASMQASQTLADTVDMRFFDAGPVPRAVLTI